MDQSVLENLERWYRRELLRKLLLADTSTHETPELGVVEFWKELSLKDTIFFAVKAWDDIPSLVSELVGINFLANLTVKL